METFGANPQKRLDVETFPNVSTCRPTPKRFHVGPLRNVSTSRLGDTWKRFSDADPWRRFLTWKRFCGKSIRGNVFSLFSRRDVETYAVFVKRFHVKKRFHVGVVGRKKQATFPRRAKSRPVETFSRRRDVETLAKRLDVETLPGLGPDVETFPRRKLARAAQRSPRSRRPPWFSEEKARRGNVSGNQKRFHVEPSRRKRKQPPPPSHNSRLAEFP